MTQQLKKCICCQKEYPKTSEYFAEHYHTQRGKKYLEAKCKDCLKTYNRNYRRENAEKLNESDRKYSMTPKGAYKKLKQSKERGHLVAMTQEEFVEWYKSQPRICCYCGLKESELQIIKDSFNNKTYRLSVDRIDTKKNYEVGNLALCCLRCNFIKGDFFTQSEMMEIGRKYIAKRWEDARRH